MAIKELYIVSVIGLHLLTPSMYAGKIDVRKHDPVVYNRSIVFESRGRCIAYADAWAKQLNEHASDRHYYGMCLTIEETRNL